MTYVQHSQLKLSRLEKSEARYGLTSRQGPARERAKSSSSSQTRRLAPREQLSKWPSAFIIERQLAILEPQQSSTRFPDTSLAIMDSLVAQYSRPAFQNEGYSQEEQQELADVAPPLSLKFALPPIASVRALYPECMSLLMLTAFAVLIMAARDDR